ncbi:MAG: tyrosine-type recombinase/integrase [Caulobacteraceae bacterium]|nr:tyrosine-type recombinase/integrase [Caulobacteraceae bacterium]
MARQLHRLPPRAAITTSVAGRYADGGGLYLVVSRTGSRKWVFRFRWKGKLSDMGLGSASIVPLSRARERAAEARLRISEGANPLAEKRAARAIPTFGEFADELVTSVKSQWRNAKHGQQVQNTLEQYAASLRPLPVDQIDTSKVVSALKPIWTSKSETATRVRSRIEWVLDAAKAKGYRSGENPARWKGHLDQLLPKRARLARGHHAALPFADVPAFIKELRARPATSALALEFTILTAARSGEVRGATWREIDLPGAVWTVPAARMKAGREHRVPLSKRAVEILRDMARLTEDDPDAFVFAGPKGSRSSLSDAAFSALLKRMGRSEGITPHGFRSSFRDWAGETTTFPRDVAEMCLAHTVGDMTERAYRRGDGLARRREMIDAWSEFCTTAKIRKRVQFQTS